MAEQVEVFASKPDSLSSVSETYSSSRRGTALSSGPLISTHKQ